MRTGLLVAVRAGSAASWPSCSALSGCGPWWLVSVLGHGSSMFLCLDSCCYLHLWFSLSDLLQIFPLSSFLHRIWWLRHSIFTVYQTTFPSRTPRQFQREPNIVSYQRCNRAVSSNKGWPVNPFLSSDPHPIPRTKGHQIGQVDNIKWKMEIYFSCSFTVMNISCDELVVYSYNVWDWPLSVFLFLLLFFRPTTNTKA